MRNTTSRLAIAAVLTAGMAAPVLADVDVTVLVSKDKTITVTESLNKDVTVTIDVDVLVDLQRAAEAIALVNQTVEDNTVDRNVSVTGGDDGQSVLRFATINGPNSSSVTGNQGVTGVNQDVGVMTNQGNIWSVAVSDDDPTSPPDTFTDAQAEVDQVTNRNIVNMDAVEPTTDLDQVIFDGLIENSVNTNTGLTAVNQNTGNMNNQVNAVALAAGLFGAGSTAGPLFGGATVAMAEAALGQETTNNRVTEGADDGNSHVAAMVGSVRGNTGVTQVNQASANMGNQGNVVAVGAAVLAPQL